jgi:hypothetical protein
LAAALAKLDAQACYVSGPRGRAGRPFLIDSAILERIQDGRIFRAEIGASNSNRMFLWPPSVIERPAPANLRSDLTRLAHNSRVAKPTGHARIRVRFTRGHAAEDLWLTVIRSRQALHESFAGSEEFIAELTEDSRLWPHLARGERLLIARHLPLELAPLAPGSVSDSSPGGK